MYLHLFSYPYGSGSTLTHIGTVELEETALPARRISSVNYFNTEGSVMRLSFYLTDTLKDVLIRDRRLHIHPLSPEMMLMIGRISEDENYNSPHMYEGQVMYHFAYDYLKNKVSGFLLADALFVFLKYWLPLQPSGVEALRYINTWEEDKTSDDSERKALYGKEYDPYDESHDINNPINRNRSYYLFGQEARNGKNPKELFEGILNKSGWEDNFVFPIPTVDEDLFITSDNSSFPIGINIANQCKLIGEDGNSRPISGISYMIDNNFKIICNTAINDTEFEFEQPFINGEVNKNFYFYRLDSWTYSFREIAPDLSKANYWTGEREKTTGFELRIITYSIIATPEIPENFSGTIKNGDNLTEEQFLYLNSFKYISSWEVKRYIVHCKKTLSGDREELFLEELPPIIGSDIINFSIGLNYPPPYTYSFTENTMFNLFVLVKRLRTIRSQWDRDWNDTNNQDYVPEYVGFVEPPGYSGDVATSNFDRNVDYIVADETKNKRLDYLLFNSPWQEIGGIANDGYPVVQIQALASDESSLWKLNLFSHWKLNNKKIWFSSKSNASSVLKSLLLGYNIGLISGLKYNLEIVNKVKNNYITEGETFNLDNIGTPKAMYLSNIPKILQISDSPFFYNDAYVTILQAIYDRIFNAWTVEMCFECPAVYFFNRELNINDFIIFQNKKYWIIKIELNKSRSTYKITTIGEITN